MELEYEFKIKPEARPELSEYVIAFSGIATTWDDDAGDDVEVARLHGHRIDLALVRHDELDIKELFESLYPDIMDFESTVFGNDTCWLAKPDAQGNPVECQCLVYVDELVVDPAFRSQGIGTEMMKRMSQVIDLEDCRIGLKAFPISKDYGRERSKNEIEKVRAFYHKLGFVHAGKHFFEKDGNDCSAPRKRRGKSSRNT
ncbi:MAG: GNAT family N-acetyltransferase [Thiotrichales bacterium]